jgi:hypothetical protein
VSKPAGEAFILLPGEGRPIDLGGFHMTVKATGEETAGAFYVLGGEYVIFLGAREQSCPVGSFIYIPAGTPHGFRVGKVASRKLNVYIPAAMVGYFDDLSAAIRRGEADPDALADIAVKYSVEVIGPVPEGYL